MSRTPLAIVFLLPLLAACASSTSLSREATALEAIHFASDAGKLHHAAVAGNRDNAEALTGLARWHLGHGAAGPARLLLARATATPDCPPEAWALLARLLYRDGQPEAAQLALARGLARAPADPVLVKARAELDRQRLIRQCQARLAAAPGDTATRRQLAFALLEAGHVNLGLAEIEAVLRSEGNSGELIEAVIRVLEARHLPDRALPWFERLLLTNPGHARALDLLSRDAIDRDDLWRANTLLLTGIQYRPDDRLLLERTGFLSLRLGKAAEGRTMLERAHALGQRSQALASTLGHIVLSQDKNTALAEKYFEEARHFLPDEELAAGKRSRLLLENQRLAQYVDFYADDSRRLATILTRLAENMLELGEYRQAHEHAVRVLELLPASLGGLLCKARAELALARTEQALATLLRARALSPDNHLVSWYLAAVHASPGMADPDVRLDHLLEAARLAPDETRYSEAIARHHLDNNAPEKALDWYRRAAGRGPAARAALTGTITGLERQLIERDLGADEKSARGSSSGLLAVARSYQTLLGDNHPGVYRCLRDASALTPRHAGLHVLAADAAARVFLADPRHDLLDQARTHLEAALALEPGNADALALKARVRRFELEQPGDIVQIAGQLRMLDLLSDPLTFDDLVAGLPGDDEATATRHFLTGKMMFNKNRDPAAARYLAKALSIPSRHSAGIARALGSILRETGDLQGAIRAYGRLLAVPNLANYNDYAITSLVIGNLYAELARTEPASLADFRSTLTGPADALPDQAAIQRLAASIRANIGYAEQAYQGYIQRCSFDTHKSRGQALIRALADIRTSDGAIRQRLAALHADAGEPARAVALLRQGLAQSPTGDDARMLLADLATLLSRLGQTGEANAVWTDLVNRFPNDWRSHHAHARQLVSQGDLARSIDAFERAARLAPRDTDIRTALGFLYWKQGAPEKAIAALQAQLEADENNLHALYYISKIELERGNLAAAIGYGEQLVNRFKRAMGQNYADNQRRDMLLDTLATLARASFRNGAVTRCLEYVYEGIDLDSGDRFGFLALAGDVRILQEKFDEAEQFYARAVQADTGNALYRFKLAQAILSSGKKLQASRILKDLYENDRAFVKRQDVHLIYADLLFRQDRHADAKAVLENLIEEFPHVEAGYLALARFHTDAGRVNEGLAVLDRGLAHIRTAPGLRDALAWLLASHGSGAMLERARHLALENILACPDTIDYRATLGYVLLRLGQPASSGAALPGNLALRYAARKQPAPAAGTTIAAATGHFRARRYALALDMIAAGEGSRELIASERASRGLFALLLDGAKNAAGSHAF